MMKGRRLISESLVLTADAYTGVELAVFDVKTTPLSWRYRATVTRQHQVRWRPVGEDEWNIRSNHRTVGAAIKELCRLRDASHGLTFTKRDR